MQSDKRIYNDNIQSKLQRKSSHLIQHIHGMGANDLLKETDEELCERLVLRYESTDLADDPNTKDDSPLSREALTEILLETIARRKANFFSGRRDKRETSAKKKSA